MSNSTIGERIDGLLRERGISGSRMSADLGMSRSFMTELRKGRAKGVNAETAARIADYLGVSTDYLLGKSPTPQLTDDPMEQELAGYLEELRSRPEQRMLFSVTRKATRERVEAIVHLIEEMGWDQLVISIKSSDVMMCVKAHELIAGRTDYPLHVGITEAGTVYAGNIKSSVGLGIILHEGIGDTIRVSLTGDPVEEVKTAKLILRTLGLRKGGIEVVSCPTCGRTRIDLISLAGEVETMAAEFDDLNIKVAVMGCVVNGPGEAREADIGIAGGVGEGLLIKKGQILRKVPEAELLAALRAELLAMAEERRK